MPWPTSDEYSEAFQHPELCMVDERLKHGQPQCDRFGIPIVRCGQFAAVSRFDCGADAIWAVRVFLSDNPKVRERYTAIGDYLNKRGSDLFVQFEYQTEGIYITTLEAGQRRTRAYPLLLMQWVEGKLLSQYVGNLAQHRDSHGLLQLAERWVAMLEDLERAQVAHGDLQHGNVLVQADGQLRLVDYDGIWIPDFAGQTSYETGLPDYQHPRRTSAHFGPTLDRFAGTAVFAALLALSKQPELWQQFGTPDTMLFTAKDYADPARSGLFAALRCSADTSVREAGALLEEMLARDPLDGADPSQLRGLLKAAEPSLQPPPNRRLRQLPDEVGLMINGGYVPVFAVTSELPWVNDPNCMQLFQWSGQLRATQARGTSWVIDPVVGRSAGGRERSLGRISKQYHPGERPFVRVSLDCYGKLTVRIDGKDAVQCEYWPWHP